MHGEMAGFYEARTRGPDRHLYRLSCILENNAPGLDSLSIIVIDGLSQTSRHSSYHSPNTRGSEPSETSIADAFRGTRFIWMHRTLSNPAPISDSSHPQRRQHRDPACDFAPRGGLQAGPGGPRHAQWLPLGSAPLRRVNHVCISKSSKVSSPACDHSLDGVPILARYWRRSYNQRAIHHGQLNSVTAVALVDQRLRNPDTMRVSDAHQVCTDRHG
jgi:hypothetical protein